MEKPRGEPIGLVRMGLPEAPVCIFVKQRYGIYPGIKEGKSKKAIAAQIGVHHSTVRRERAVTATGTNGNYFADAYASWQKGAIENTNKHIRQYIPKETGFNLSS